jgi:hypothetical protein
MNICLGIFYLLIFLLQKQKLNHINYYEQEIKMDIFVQVNYHDVHMYTKFGYSYFYGFL